MRSLSTIRHALSARREPAKLIYPYSHISSTTTTPVLRTAFPNLLKLLARVISGLIIIIIITIDASHPPSRPPLPRKTNTANNVPTSNPYIDTFVLCRYICGPRSFIRSFISFHALLSLLAPTLPSTWQNKKWLISATIKHNVMLLLHARQAVSTG